MSGGGAAAAAHDGGHGGQGEHLLGVVGGRHVVDCLAPFCSGQTCIGLEEQRGGGIRPHLFKDPGHFLGAQAAVQAKQINTHALHEGHHGPGRAASEKLAGGVENTAGKDGQGAVLLGGHQSGLHLVQVAHGLNEDGVGTGLLGGGNGVGKKGHGILKVQVAVGL